MSLSKVFNRTDSFSLWSRSARGLVLFFLTGLFLLTFAGFIFKIVFVIYNSDTVSEMPWSEVVYALLWGLRFDLASAAILILVGCIVLWLFYRFIPSKKPAPALLMILLAVQITFQMGDAIYYANAGRHVSYEMRDAITDASGLFLTAITHHAFFVFCGLVLGFVVLAGSLGFMQWLVPLLHKGKAISWKFNLQYEASFLFVLLLAVVLVRGGVTGLPQSVISAFKIGDSQLAVVTMNGAYSVIYGIFNSSKEVQRLAINLPENVDANEVMRSLYPITSFDQPNKEIKKYNLVFIFLEGWPAELMASYGYEQDTTPFFDSIFKKSYAPLGVIAGGRRTTEGLFSTLCSQQNPLGATVAQSSLQNFEYRCLPEILKNMGWNTIFFQGSHKETSGTGAFAQSMGFSGSYAKEDMPDGRYQRNFWGAHDPDIYDFVLNKLDETPQPFFVALNTNSTHDLVLPEGIKPFFGDANTRQQHLSILRFADDSLKEFFEKIKSKSYYKKTIFVLISDHSTGRQSNAFYKYFIPGVIYAEDLVRAGQVDRLVSQRDIAPTVIDILGFSKEPSFVGKSFYENNSSEDVYFSDYFYAGSIGWVSGREIIETNISRPDIVKCYLINNKKMMPVSKECNMRDKKLSEQSLVFTAYNQDRLFNGETKQFYKFLNE